MVEITTINLKDFVQNWKRAKVFSLIKEMLTDLVLGLSIGTVHRAETSSSLAHSQKK